MHFSLSYVNFPPFWVANTVPQKHGDMMISGGYHGNAFDPTPFISGTDGPRGLPLPVVS